MMAVCSQPLFRLASNCIGDPDFTQLPVKASFLLFCVEVIVCMLFFPRAAMSFASRHISRATVRRMSTGILIFNIAAFWISYLTVFCFIFFGTDEVGPNARRLQRFPTDMYLIPPLTSLPIFSIKPGRETGTVCTKYGRGTG